MQRQRGKVWLHGGSRSGRCKTGGERRGRGRGAVCEELGEVGGVEAALPLRVVAGLPKVGDRQVFVENGQKIGLQVEE